MADNSSYLEDRRQLELFVKDTHEFLQGIVRSKKDTEGKVLFPTELHSEIDAAWAQFSRRFSLDLAASKIIEAKDAQIAAAGLYGAELRLKLSLIKRLKDLFGLKGGARLLSKLFNAIDNLLDSIIAATGLHVALKEIKDALNSCLD